jgi:hypothetical protein
MQVETLQNEILYIGAAGFEDRGLAFVENAVYSGKKFRSCLAIEYEPFNPRNRKSEFSKLSREVFDTTSWISYHRVHPEIFARTLLSLPDLSNQALKIVVDISGMSKFLIVVLLQSLREFSLPLSVMYAPAKIYHPTREEYEKAKANLTDPYFLTTDVYKVITTTQLSSIAMQGSPLAMIAFPNFNYLEIAALINEMSAQKLILIDSTESPSQNAWRMEAIKWINRGLESYVTPIHYETDAMDLRTNLDLLDQIYDQYHLTHKIAVAPTGGKLQALATYCLKNIHPDVHIVYPLVREFAADYSDGYTSHFEISFTDFRAFVTTLNAYRKRILETPQPQ